MQSYHDLRICNVLPGYQQPFHQVEEIKHKCQLLSSKVGRYNKNNKNKQNDKILRDEERIQDR